MLAAATVIIIDVVVVIVVCIVGSSLFSHFFSVHISRLCEPLFIILCILIFIDRCFTVPILSIVYMAIISIWRIGFFGSLAFTN